MTTVADAPLRVVIAEDAALFREGLIRLLSERGHRVCAGTGNEWANGFVSPLDESFHPMARGYQEMATRLRSQILPL